MQMCMAEGVNHTEVTRTHYEGKVPRTPIPSRSCFAAWPLPSSYEALSKWFQFFFHLDFLVWKILSQGADVRIHDDMDKRPTMVPDMKEK